MPGIGGGVRGSDRGAEGGGQGSEVGRGVGTEGWVWRRLSEKVANGEVGGK